MYIVYITYNIAMEIDGFPWKWSTLLVRRLPGLSIRCSVGAWPLIVANLVSLQINSWSAEYHHMYVHVCDCIHMWLYTYVCMYVCMYACMYACMHVCMYIHVYMYTCIHVYMYTCIHVYMYTCVYVYMCIYIYIKLYIYVWHSSIQGLFQYLWFKEWCFGECQRHSKTSIHNETGCLLGCRVDESVEGHHILSPTMVTWIKIDSKRWDG